MNKETLEGKKLSVEQQFSDLNDQRSQLMEEIRKIDEEQLKLSGEYRLLSTLLDDINDAAPTEQLDRYDSIHEAQIVENKKARKGKK